MYAEVEGFVLRSQVPVTEKHEETVGRSDTRVENKRAVQWPAPRWVGYNYERVYNFALLSPVPGGTSVTRKA